MCIINIKIYNYIYTKISLGNPWQIPLDVTRYESAEASRVSKYTFIPQKRIDFSSSYFIMGRLVPAHNEKSSPPEPLVLSQPNFTQSILCERKFKFVHMKGHALFRRVIGKNNENTLTKSKKKSFSPELMASFNLTWHRTRSLFNLRTVFKGEIIIQ